MIRKWMLFVIAILLSGCSGSTTYLTPSLTNEPPPHQIETAALMTIDISQINVRNYPRVDGSTSAYPLQITLACRILGVPWVWQESDPFGPTRSIITAPEFIGSLDLIERIFNIRHNGTHGSYMNLIEGNADVILVARLPSEDELRAAQQDDVELDAKPIALDAFVFLVNEENPVDDLTLENIRDIYTGEITRWWELGGSIKKIHTYQRNRNSGSQELMEKLVMRGVPMIESPDMMLDSMLGPIHAIINDPFGIGYSVYFYAAFIFPHEQVKLIAVDGVLPTSENIASRLYPLTTEVYAVIRADTPQDSSARLFRDWLQTEEGQAAIAESGYVPINN